MVLHPNCPSKMPQPCGSIELIIGPMFSGKTTELLRRVRRLRVAGYRVLLINYAGDQRYSQSHVVTTHDAANEEGVAVTRLDDGQIQRAISEADVVAVNEGQFFPDLYEVCSRLADSMKRVIVAGLDATYERKPFPQMVELLCMSEKVTKLSAVCMVCKTGRGVYSMRTSSERELIVIGGADKYVAACRACYVARNATPCP